MRTIEQILQLFRNNEYSKLTTAERLELIKYMENENGEEED